MNRREFIETLGNLLPNEVRPEILADFQEHFNTGISQGKTEEDIVNELGNPYDIAKEYGYDPAKGVSTPVNTQNSYWALVGLVVFDVFVGFSLVASAVGILFGFWAAVVGIAVASLALFLSLFITIFVSVAWPVALFGGLSLLGLAGLLAVGMSVLTKLFVKLMKIYIDLHRKVINDCNIGKGGK